MSGYRVECLACGRSDVCRGSSREYCSMTVCPRCRRRMELRGVVVEVTPGATTWTAANRERATLPDDQGDKGDRLLREALGGLT